MEEIWKEIEGYEGFYFISSLGRVKSAKRTTTKGNLMSVKSNRYPKVTLCKNGNLKTFNVHRLVANAFIENPHNKKTINHINGVKSDNRVQNLEWNTYKENINHSFKTKLNVVKKGEEHHSAKIKNKDVDFIIKMSKNGIKDIDIAKKFNVARQTINAIRLGKERTNK
jgi:hypothetical protein